MCGAQSITDLCVKSSICHVMLESFRLFFTFLYAYRVPFCLLLKGVVIISIKEQGKHKGTRARLQKVSIKEQDKHKGTTVPFSLVLVSVKEHMFLFAYKK